MDIDELAPNSSNSTLIKVSSPQDNATHFHARFLLELFTAVAILSLLSNLLIVSVVLKYKKLRRNVTNVILLHVNVLQAMFLLTAPVTLRVVMTTFTDYRNPLHRMVNCLLNEVEGSLILGLYCLILILTTDGYLSTYCTRVRYDKFKHVYKFLLALAYIITILGAVVTMQTCVGRYSRGPIAIILVAMVMLINCVPVVIVNIVHQIKRRQSLQVQKHNMGLAVANIFVAVWLPVLGMLLVTFFGYFPHPLVYVTAVCFGFSSPIINVIYLYVYVDDFGVFFKKIFTCECSSGYEDDVEGSEEEHSTTIVTHNETKVVEIVCSPVI